MKGRCRNLIILNTALVIIPCSVYQPQPFDIPLITDKKDLRIDAGIASNLSAQATLSYGIIDHLSLQAAAGIGSDDKYFVQGAIGYFNNPGKNTITELYGGVGFGHGRAYREASPGYLYGDHQLYFTQFNLGRLACKPFQMTYGIGMKAGLFSSYLTDENYYKYYSEEGPFPFYHLYCFLFEPAAFLRLGAKKPH